MKAFKSIITIIISMAFATSPAWADTLVLKTGDRITGSFEGGTARVVRFRPSSGGVKEYDVLSIQQIQFSDEQKTTVVPRTSAEPPASATEDTVYTIPAGSKISIRMIDSIGENQTAGSLFLASLDVPLMDRGLEVVPKGADVWGRVTGPSPLGLELTQMFFDGNTYSMNTTEYREVGENPATVQAKTKGETLNIPAETKLEFTLKAPLVVATLGM